VKTNKASMNFINKSSMSVGRKTSLGYYAFKRLREDIIIGNISPEIKLNESRISKALGISRTPIREALYKLEQECLIRKLPRGGYAVRSLNYEDIEESFDLTGILESYAARLATIRQSEDDIFFLEETLDEFQKYLDQGRYKVLPDVKKKFHSRLYAMSQSERLLKIIKYVGDQMYPVRKAILNGEELATICQNDQRNILEAIKRMDVDEVEKLIKEHILRGKNFILKKLSELSENDQSKSFSKLLNTKTTKVLLAKVGMDCHDRGIKFIAHSLQDAEMEVIYTGLYKSVSEVVDQASRRAVDVIGLSIMYGYHINLFYELKASLEKKNLRNILTIVGGLIPKKDIPELKKLGIARVFTSGCSSKEIINFINEHASFDLLSRQAML
jgi:methylmalonyl-CoA mutase C-terminal domain/subunit